MTARAMLAGVDRFSGSPIRTGFTMKAQLQPKFGRKNGGAAASAGADDQAASDLPDALSADAMAAEAMTADAIAAAAMTDDGNANTNVAPLVTELPPPPPIALDLAPRCQLAARPRARSYSRSRAWRRTPR